MLTCISSVDNKSGLDVRSITMATDPLDELVPVPSCESYGYWPNPDKRLGKGSFGFVHEGCANRDLTKAVDRELLPLTKSMNHRNILSILGHSGIQRKVSSRFASVLIFETFIIMEYCLGHLATYFNNETLSVDSTLDIMLQCAHGLRYLHQLNVIHRDLKPTNILIKKINSVVIVKLSDFGSSRELKIATESLTIDGVGTRPWNAPEQSINLPYTFAVDRFALGHIFLALVVCKAAHCVNCNHLVVHESMFKLYSIII